LTSFRTTCGCRLISATRWRKLEVSVLVHPRPPVPAPTDPAMRSAVLANAQNRSASTSPKRMPESWPVPVAARTRGLREPRRLRVLCAPRCTKHHHALVQRQVTSSITAYSKPGGRDGCVKRELRTLPRRGRRRNSRPHRTDAPRIPSGHRAAAPTGEYLVRTLTLCPFDRPVASRYGRQKPGTSVNHRRPGAELILHSLCHFI